MTGEPTGVEVRGAHASNPAKRGAASSGEGASRIKDGPALPGEKSNEKTSLVSTLSSNPQFKISDQDLKFLKSLRIKIDDDAA